MIRGEKGNSYLGPGRGHVHGRASWTVVCPFLNTPSCHKAGRGTLPPQNKQYPTNAASDWHQKTRGPGSSELWQRRSGELQLPGMVVMLLQRWWARNRSFKSVSDQKQQHELRVLRTRPGVLEWVLISQRVSEVCVQTSCKRIRCGQTKEGQREFLGISIKVRRWLISINALWVQLWMDAR